MLARNGIRRRTEERIRICFSPISTHLHTFVRRICVKVLFFSLEAFNFLPIRRFSSCFFAVSDRRPIVDFIINFLCENYLCAWCHADRDLRRKYAYVCNAPKIYFWLIFANFISLPDVHVPILCGGSARQAIRDFFL